MATREEYLNIADQALREGDEATAMAAMDEAEKLSSAPAKSTQEEVGILGALGSGFVRGAEQVTGGALQRVAEARKNQLDSRISEMTSGMQDGSIPVNNKTLAELDSMQAEAVKVTRALSNASGIEKQKRNEFAPIQEERPISAFVGNVAGQMAAVPIPAVRGLGLLAQSGKTAAEGAALGYIQTTIEGESATDSAALGGIVGAAVPSFLRGITNTTGATYRALTGSPTKEVADLIEYSKVNKAPLYTTDVVPPETGYGKNIRSFGATVPLTGTGAGRAGQQTARASQMQKLSDEFGVPNDSEIFDSIVRKGDKIAEAAGKRYQGIITQMGSDPIPLTETNKAIDSAIWAYTRGGRIENKALVEQLKNIKTKLNESPQDIELLRTNRTDIRERLKTDETIGRDTAARVIDKLYAGITKDMTNGVSSKLGNETASKMRQADAIYYREASEIQKTKLKNILSKGAILPDKVNTMLFSKSKPEVEILYQSLDKKGRDNARAAIFNKAFEIAQNSPERFLSEMGKLKSQNEIFFKGESGKQLNGLINYLNATREASAAAVNTPTGQRLTVLAPVALGSGGALAASGPGAIAGLGAYFGVGALASIYESAPVRSIMVRMAGVPKGSTQFEILSRKLEQEIVNASSKITPASEQKHKEKQNSLE